MTHTEKLAAAIAYLGEHWVLHPARRVLKGHYEPIVQRCDVQKTFDAVRKRMQGELPLVQVAR